MADKEATAWATSKLRLLQAAQGDTSSDLDSNEHHDQRSVLNLIVEEVDGFRELVEKYTIENEELRTKLAEAEALAEFGQRPFTLASPCHPSRCPGASSSSNRVALTNGEFPDLDTSMVAAAEAGLSAANLYLDEDVETELFVPKIQRRHRRKHRKAKSENVENNIPDWNRQPINDVTPDELPTEAWPLEVGKNKKQRLTPTKFNALGSFSSVEQSEEVTESGRVRENAASFDEEAPVTNTETDESYNEDDNVATANDTLLPDPAGDETLTHTLRGNSEPGSGNDTYSDASEVRSSSSSASDSATDEDRSVVVKPVTNEEEAKLHKSLAKLSSQIDSKQHLLAELQYKAAQLDQLRKHYERQLADLNNRIRETERERDTVLASMGQLEHIGEERLRRTREEFEKKLSSLQVSSAKSTTHTVSSYPVVLNCVFAHSNPKYPCFRAAIICATI
ncbi:unnamed protein product [Dicrocoelium dendriticum]|nr:unnamed protein product [Dicrocoelium dendriticum]